MESTQLQPQLARHAIAIKSVRGLLRERGTGHEARQLAFVFALHTTMAQIEQQERREERGRGENKEEPREITFVPLHKIGNFLVEAIINSTRRICVGSFNELPISPPPPLSCLFVYANHGIKYEYRIEYIVSVSLSVFSFHFSNLC